jgi:hypothetical protein
MIASMNKIQEGLYLGNIDAANDFANLKRNGITHILTAATGLTPAKAAVRTDVRML